MTPAEYESILLDLVDRNIITLDEAGELLRRFLSGEFPDDTLPLATEEAQRKDNDAWIALFLANRNILRRSAFTTRKHAQREIRDAFEHKTTQSISQMVDSSSVRQWHEDEKSIISGAMLTSWLVGNGRNDEPDIDEQIDLQLAYLYRFAAEQHARDALGRPFTELYLLNRALSYGGAVRGAFYRGNESVMDDGLVSQYIAKDDRGTCQPCRDAVGYYRLGEGIFPGEVCRGGYYCRCERITIYAPEILARL